MSKPNLWRNSDFRYLWIAQTISLVGSQISALALPLVAINTLAATPVQMGLLTALGSLPALLLGPFIGIWADRRHRRPMLIISDLARGLLLLTIPLAVMTGALRIELLYTIALVGGTLALWFDVAYRAYLPVLVGRIHLLEANSRLEMSRSAAEIGGPGLAGGLIQWLTAPIAILFDAFSFWMAAFLFARITTPEAPPTPESAHEPIGKALAAGFALILHHPLLRSLAGCLATIGLFNAMLEAVALLYLTRQLALAPGMLGLIFAAGNVGFLAGAFLPERLAKLWGSGRALAAGLAIFAASDLIYALMTGPTLVVVALLIIAQFGFGLGFTIFNVIHVSLRQTHTPDALQGRMHATMVCIMQGIAPLGALAGGLLGEWVGLRPTLIVAALGELSALFWLWTAPFPAQVEAEAQVEVEAETQP
jgi:MFS family permease